ncbi:MAG TPA: hypothetical protein PLP34_02580, partial [Chitinophagaceae bacterium]|nr:hypothetical protein [Chitinophagaceae bacterium]
MKKTLLFLMVLMTALNPLVKAQDNDPEQEQESRISAVESTLEKLLHLKITGYVHAQFQFADSLGSINSYTGGSWAKDVDERFTIRRSRLKFVWDKQDEEKNVLGSAVFQIDFSQNGVALRDAYLTGLLPW